MADVLALPLSNPIMPIGVQLTAQFNPAPPSSAQSL
jgi:hypothetical protein